jgi:hypothetical protein
MIKRSLIFLLSTFFLMSQFHTVTTATRDYAPRNIDIERSSKNILVGSYLGGRSHLKPILDVASILIERGHKSQCKGYFLFYVYLIRLSSNFGLI